MVLYVNGRQQQPTSDITTSHGASIRNFLIGADPGRDQERLPEHSFVGYLYAIRISDRARYDRNFTPPDELSVDQHSLAVYDARKSVEGKKLRNLAADKWHGEIHGAAPTEVPAWPAGKKLAVLASGDWIDLFNGTNLAGWTGDSANWSVQDGLLTGRGHSETIWIPDRC